MIMVLKPNTAKNEIKNLSDRIREKGLKPVEFEGAERTVIQKPFKLASREHHQDTTIVKIGEVPVGNGDFVVIAGPCSIESEEQIMESAEMLKSLGIKIMRASAFKPRTSPYDFQGMGIEGLKLLKKAREKTGLLVETEVMDVRDAAIAAEYVDVLRVGARNMQNYDLLKELGKVNKPVILKRGISATINEFIMAAEYLLFHGNRNVILCERGIRTFETAYRNTLDIGGVAVLKGLTHLPVIVDPSHAAGNRDLVLPLSRAAAAVGADGLLVECHPNPEKALSDGAQSLYPMQLSKLLKEIKPICRAVGKGLR